MKTLNYVLLISVFLCARAQAETCTVGVDGCSWTCIPPPPGKPHCLLLKPDPTSCEIGSSDTTCGRTCTCSKAEKCTVGVDGCKLDCVNLPATTGPKCFAIIAPPTECYPGQKITDCVKTCTCSKVEKCTVGVNGCKWDCVNLPATTGPRCLAIIAPPSECYPGQKITDCVKTCTCNIGCTHS